MWRTLRAGKAQGRVPMRCAVVAAVLLTFTPSLTLAQAPSSADVNHAIDAAERICLVGNRYKFQVDASGNLTISKLLPGAAANVTVDRAEAKGSQFFENEEVRRLVDQDIRDCMKGQWIAVLPYLADKTALQSYVQTSIIDVNSLITKFGLRPFPIGSQLTSALGNGDLYNAQ